MLRRFFLISLCLAITLVTTTPVFAQTAQTNIIKEKQDAIQKGTNQESWLNEAMSGNIVSALQVLTGPIPNDVLDGKPVVWIPGGILGTTNNLIASMYTKQASGIDYLADLWHNNFLGKPAYAQGIGFKGLQPILPIWRGFRNAVYLLSSLIFIVLGIMIILRVKISPQAVVTIQSAIPQIITTLILVTFSYAIAGLLIDLSYLFQSLTLATLFTSLEKNFNNNLFEPDLVARLIEWLQKTSGATISSPYNFEGLANAGFLKNWALINLALPQTMILMLSVVIGGTIGAIVGQVSTMPLPIIGQITALGGFGIGAALFFLIIQIIILINLLKFFFGLIKCYLNIFLKIILSPLEIGIGAFPNSKGGFSSWVTGLLANLSVFPLSTLFLVLLNILVEKSGSGLWQPPILGIATSITPALIGFAGIILIAQLPTLIPQAIFQLKPSPWDQAISQATDISRNPIVRFAKSSAANYVADQIAAPTTGLGVFVNNALNKIGGNRATKAASEGMRTFTKQ